MSVSSFPNISARTLELSVPLKCDVYAILREIFANAGEVEG